MNTRQQGDIGLGAAIAYHTSLSHTVSVPLSESQRYDLVIDDGTLRRVEIKTTTYQRNGHYVALIKTNGGNRSGTGKTTLFDPNSVDLLFVWTPDGCYEFPAHEVGCTGTLALNQSREKYRVSPA